jgi:hypothetical protein
MNPFDNRLRLQLPPDWTPQQAVAVHHALNELLGLLWLQYEEALREQLQPEPECADPRQSELFDFDDPLPF